MLNEEYLGLHIFRFYIRCPRCSGEIAFKVRDEERGRGMVSGGEEAERGRERYNKMTGRGE